MPQADALGRHWESLPPPDLQLKRISLFLGLPDTAPTGAPKPAAPADALREAALAGLPVMEGRPDDPLLDFLDLNQ